MSRMLVPTEVKDFAWWAARLLAVTTAFLGTLALCTSIAKSAIADSPPDAGFAIALVFTCVFGAFLIGRVTAEVARDVESSIRGSER